MYLHLPPWPGSAHDRLCPIRNRPDQTDCINTYSKHSLILHTEKWFKMGPMKPKTDSDFRVICLCQPLGGSEDTVALQLQYALRKKIHHHASVTVFLIRRHSCDKGSGSVPLVFLRTHLSQEEKTNICIGFCFSSCLVTSFQLKWRPLHDLQTQGEMNTGKYAVS